MKSDLPARATGYSRCAWGVRETNACFFRGPLTSFRGSVRRHQRLCELFVHSVSPWNEARTRRCHQENAACCWWGVALEVCLELAVPRYRVLGAVRPDPGRHSSSVRVWFRLQADLR